jgi:hypothetical protein
MSIIIVYPDEPRLLLHIAHELLTRISKTVEENELGPQGFRTRTPHD